jgi:hypothetical protein
MALLILPAKKARGQRLILPCPAMNDGCEGTPEQVKNILEAVRQLHRDKGNHLCRVFLLLMMMLLL